jgi:cysteine desulfuration protein SufE
MIAENFPPELDELVETFEYLDEWDERYDYIIELGRKLPTIDPALQTKENIVEGCMSTVWLVTYQGDKHPDEISIVADSDSIIVKGLIVILLSALSGKSAKDIIQFDVEQLFRQFGLNQHLSPNRRNGLFSMVKRIRQLAVNQESGT